MLNRKLIILTSYGYDMAEFINEHKYVSIVDILELYETTSSAKVNYAKSVGYAVSQCADDEELLCWITLWTAKLEF